MQRNFYKYEDYEELAAYVDEYREGGYIESPDDVFPFSLELVISYLCNEMKEKGFAFVFHMDNFSCRVEYAYPKAIRVKILGIENYIEFSEFDLAQKGEITAHLDEYEVGVYSLLDIKDHFDPHHVNRDEQLQQQYLKGLEEACLEVFPEFELKSFDVRSFLKQLRNPYAFKTLYFLDERSNWDNYGLTQLLRKKLIYNRKLLSRLVGRVEEYTKCLAVVDSVETLVTIDRKEVEIEIRIGYDIITNRDEMV